MLSFVMRLPPPPTGFQSSDTHAVITCCNVTWVWTPISAVVANSSTFCQFWYCLWMPTELLVFVLFFRQSTELLIFTKCQTRLDERQDLYPNDSEVKSWNSQVLQTQIVGTDRRIVAFAISGRVCCLLQCCSELRAVNCILDAKQRPVPMDFVKCSGKQKLLKRTNNFFYCENNNILHQQKICGNLRGKCFSHQTANKKLRTELFQRTKIQLVTSFALDMTLVFTLLKTFPVKPQYPCNYPTCSSKTLTNKILNCTPWKFISDELPNPTKMNFYLVDMSTE